MKKFIEFYPKDIPIIHPEWVLRNDSSYLILYKISSSESKRFVLHPISACIVCLINGKNSYDKICKTIKSVFGFDDFGKSQKIFNEITNSLNTESHVIIKKNSHNNINIFDTSEYYIPIGDYNYPKQSRFKLPTNVMLITTSSCQTDCMYCYAERNVSNNSYLSYDKWIKIIDECLKLNIFNIEMSGGDSLADSTSMEIILYLIRSKIPVFISTKSKIKESYVRALIDSGFKHLNRSLENIFQISIDSCQDEIADLLTGCKNYLNRADSNIQLLQKYDINPKIKCVLTCYNYGEIIDMLEKYSAMGIINFQFVYYGYSYFRNEKSLLLSEKMKQSIHNTKMKISDKYDKLKISIQDDGGTITNPISDIHQKKELWNKRARCSGGYSSMTILPDGKVVLCEQIPNKKEFIVGDINKNTIEEIWNSHELKTWLFPSIDRFNNTACSHCEEFSDCVHNAGWCYRDTLFAYDTIYEAPPSCPNQIRKGRRLS